MLEAKRDFEEIQFWHQTYEERITRNEKSLAEIERELVEQRQKSAQLAEDLFIAGQCVAKLAEE